MPLVPNYGATTADAERGHAHRPASAFATGADVTSASSLVIRDRDPSRTHDDALSSASSSTATELPQDSVDSEDGDKFTHATAAWNLRPSWRAWLNEDISPDRAIPSMLVVTFSTSLLDSIMLSLYACFATNQTGNTILLALATHHPGRKLTLTATSMAGFVGAGLVFGQIGARFGHRHRGWVLCSLTYQTVLLFLFTFLISPLGPDATQQYGTHEWLGMLVAAVQGGPQIVMGTSINSLMPTGMVTSVIANVLSDPNLFTMRGSRERDLRLVYLATFVGGALAGLGLEVSTSLWFSGLVSALLKLTSIVMLCTLRNN